MTRKHEKEYFDDSKIKFRLEKLVKLKPEISQKVVDLDKIIKLTNEQAFDMISTSDIDKLTSEISA